MDPHLGRLARGLLLLLPLAFAGCSHDYQFTQQPSVGRMASHALTGKRIALDLSRTPDVLDTSANGHSFHVHGIRGHVTAVVTGLFGADMVVKDPAAADDVLALDLDLRIGSAFLGTEATAAATWRIRDRSGQEIATGSSSSSSAFPTMANGGRNCEIAALQAMSQALDAAMAKVR